MKVANILRMDSSKPVQDRIDALETMANDFAKELKDFNGFGYDMLFANGTDLADPNVPYCTAFTSLISDWKIFSEFAKDVINVLEINSKTIPALNSSNFILDLFRLVDSAFPKPSLPPPALPSPPPASALNEDMQKVVTAFGINFNQDEYKDKNATVCLPALAAEVVTPLPGQQEQANSNFLNCLVHYLLLPNSKADVTTPKELFAVSRLICSKLENNYAQKCTNSAFSPLGIIARISGVDKTPDGRFIYDPTPFFVRPLLDATKAKQFVQKVISLVDVLSTNNLEDNKPMDNTLMDEAIGIFKTQLNQTDFKKAIGKYCGVVKRVMTDLNGMLGK